VRREDRRQLGRAVRPEVQLRVDPALQAGIHLQHAQHRLVVAGEDHDETRAVVFHALEQRRDRLVAEIIRRGVEQRVRLVDQQHAVERCVDGLRSLDRGLADVAGDQAAAIDLDDFAARQQARAT
jgi:hypothetical protein